MHDRGLEADGFKLRDTVRTLSCHDVRACVGYGRVYKPTYIAMLRRKCKVDFTANANMPTVRCYSAGQNQPTLIGAKDRRLLQAAAGGTLTYSPLPGARALGLGWF
ncbi:hypothetical protein G7Z17_g7047 [Cylindrodendrum hubeiense]|uniref:Uncharacterized protein n=1 Tax=Cylindrodendrum hubeiense TaxID=595255 RepID=A0A9P5H8Q0_9HYPO|nr:hypothetical protein G7Z17_g7047 [Cylindrodendrum hubeiense]